MSIVVNPKKNKVHNGQRGVGWFGKTVLLYFPFQPWTSMVLVQWGITNFQFFKACCVCDSKCPALSVHRVAHESDQLFGVSPGCKFVYPIKRNTATVYLSHYTRDRDVRNISIQVDGSFNTNIEEMVTRCCCCNNIKLATTHVTRSMNAKKMHESNPCSRNTQSYAQ